MNKSKLKNKYGIIKCETPLFFYTKLAILWDNSLKLERQTVIFHFFRFCPNYENSIYLGDDLLFLYSSAFLRIPLYILMNHVVKQTSGSFFFFFLVFPFHILLLFSVMSFRNNDFFASLVVS